MCRWCAAAGVPPPVLPPPALPTWPLSFRVQYLLPLFVSEEVFWSPNGMGNEAQAVGLPQGLSVLTKHMPVWLTDQDLRCCLSGLKLDKKTGQPPGYGCWHARCRRQRRRCHVCAGQQKACQAGPRTSQHPGLKHWQLCSAPRAEALATVLPAPGNCAACAWQLCCLSCLPAAAMARMSASPALAASQVRTLLFTARQSQHQCSLRAPGS